MLFWKMIKLFCKMIIAILENFNATFENCNAILENNNGILEDYSKESVLCTVTYSQHRHSARLSGIGNTTRQHGQKAASLRYDCSY